METLKHKGRPDLTPFDSTKVQHWNSREEMERCGMTRDRKHCCERFSSVSMPGEHMCVYVEGEKERI